MIVGMGDTKVHRNTGVDREQQSVTLHFSVAEKCLATLDSAVVMDTMESSAVLLGPWLEELHIVLRDEARLSIQSPLQPAWLLRRVNCNRKGREQEETTLQIGREEDECCVCRCEGEGSLLSKLHNLRICLNQSF